MSKVRWGILGAAKIAIEKVIPAMQQSDLCEIVAIASRDADKAARAASQLGIPAYYNNYEQLLQNENIDAIYIPLPNDMHVPWAIKALKHNKHVLCEKPIGLTSKEALDLFSHSQKSPHLKVMEAFMYKFHPQWVKTKQLVDGGVIGELRTIQAFFSYFNNDPGNIRNILASGGGGLMDIGCYCISQSRFITSKEPLRVHGIIDYDTVLKTDRMASATLDFGGITSTFTCSTQLNPFQRFHIFGTNGSIEIIIPVNAPPTEATKILLHTKEKTEEIFFEQVNQYTLQGEALSKSIINDAEVPHSLEDSINNMKVIEAVVESNRTGKWINII
jgi:predicted dehydrogenase